jgi:signal transduction histidine kinase
MTDRKGISEHTEPGREAFNHRPKYPIMKTMAFANPNSTNPALDQFLLQLASQYSLAKRFRAGDVLYTEGQPGSTMLLVLQGTLGVQKRVKDSGQLRTIATRGPGDFLGEMAIVEESPRSATVVARSDCEVLEFSHASFERAIKEQPALATRVLKSLSRKLRESDSFRILELEESNRALSASNAELTSLNLFLDRLIEESPSAVLIVRRNGDVFRHNRAAVRMFEIAGDSVDLYIRDLLPDLRLLQSDVAGEGSRHVEATGVRGSATFPVLSSVSLFDWSDTGGLYLIICQDISELQALNETVVAVGKHEAAADVVAEVAHDIKNHLAILSGHFQLLMTRLTAEQQQRSAQSINAIESTHAEILRFLENAMISDHCAVSQSRVDLANLMRTLIRFCRSQSVFSQIEFKLDVEAGFPKAVTTSEDQIRRIVLNLVLNAAEALKTVEREGTRSVSIQLTWLEKERVVQIRVKDNGPGISPDHLAKVFKQRFTTKKSGHGIGLVSVARIVESQGGRISVTSAPDTGTVFEIILPVQVEPRHA